MAGVLFDVNIGLRYLSGGAVMLIGFALSLRYLRRTGQGGGLAHFRCRWGEVYSSMPGKPTPNRKALPPVGDEAFYTVFHEIFLQPGEQYTLMPETSHWFQAGTQGATVSEFSTTSRDESDLFTDPRIVRAPAVAAGAD